MKKFTPHWNETPHHSVHRRVRPQRRTEQKPKAQASLDGVRIIYSTPKETGIPESSPLLPNGQPVFLSTRMPEGGELIEMDRDNARLLFTKLEAFGDDCSLSCHGLRLDLQRAFEMESAAAV